MVETKANLAMVLWQRAKANAANDLKNALVDIAAAYHLMSSVSDERALAIHQDWAALYNRLQSAPDPKQKLENLLSKIQSRKSDSRPSSPTR